MDNVEFANFQILAFDPFHQIRANVARDDMHGGSHTLCAPLRQRAIARANLQATPSRRNTSAH
jgi:hypothetical protein